MGSVHSKQSKTYMKSIRFRLLGPISKSSSDRKTLFYSSILTMIRFTATADITIIIAQRDNIFNNSIVILTPSAIVVARVVTVIRLLTRRPCHPAAAIQLSYVVFSFSLIFQSLLVVTTCVRNFSENNRV